MRLLSIRLLGLSALVAMLCSSQTHWFGSQSPWLVDTQQTSTVSSTAQYQAYLAAKAGGEEALAWLVDNAESGSYWLSAAADLGSDKAQLQVWLGQPSRTDMLLAAAQQGNAEAQYRWALSQEHMPTRLVWLERAARQGSLPSEIALYRWFVQQGLWSDALPWLEAASEKDKDASLLLAKYHWRRGAYEQSRGLLQNAADQGHDEAKNLSQLIQRYWQNPVELENREHCQQRLAFVATSLSAMVQADDVMQRFHNDDRLQGLPICLSEVRWLSNQTLQCSDRWQGAGRLGCDLAAIAPEFVNSRVTHLVVFADRGKANVNNGVMFLDSADSYSVFVHELAHFAGLVDEYPLSAGLAEQFCYPGFRAPNLVVVANRDPADGKALAPSENPVGSVNTNLELSAVGATEASLEAPDGPSVPAYWSQARTCEQNSGVQAYKISPQLTFMEYHDTENIPLDYRQAWGKALERAHQLPSFHLNIAQGLEYEGDTEAAALWWQKFRDFRNAAVATDDIEGQPNP